MSAVRRRFWTVGLIVAVAVLAFLCLTVSMTSIWTGVDRSCWSWFARHRSTPATAVFDTASALGSPGPLLLAAVVLAVGLTLRKRPAEAAAVVVANGGAALSTQLVKVVVGRDRPVVVVHLAAMADHALPSAHTSQAAVFYGLLVLRVLRPPWPSRTGPLVRGALGVLVGLVGLSRLYLGVHWLTDVLAGYAMAAAWVAVGGLILDREPMDRRRPSRAPDQGPRPDGPDHDR